MDAPDYSGAETLILQFDVFISLYTPILLQGVEKFLNLDGGQFLQRDLPNPWDNVVVDVVQIVVLCLLPESGLSVHFVPQFDPALDGISFHPGHIQLLAITNCFL